MAHGKRYIYVTESTSERELAETVRHEKCASQVRLTGALLHDAVCGIRSSYVQMHSRKHGCMM